MKSVRSLAGVKELLSAVAKAGKSMLAMNLAVSVASGRSFLGMETTQGKVLYLQTEVSAPTLAERIEMMLTVFNEQEREFVNENFHIADDRIRLDTTEGLALLYEQLDKLSPSLLIIDPLYELHRKNEDSSSEMGPLLTNIRAISKTKNCGLVLVHHQGKRGEGGSSHPAHAGRGTSAFGDIPDICLSLNKESGSHKLRGVFRARQELEGLVLRFDDMTLTYAPAEGQPKIRKTREIIVETLREAKKGLTRFEIVQLVAKERKLTSSAIGKHLEEMQAERTVTVEGRARNTTYQLVTVDGGNAAP